jgi:hypothetical protein
LEDSVYPKKSTWVELELRSPEKKNALSELLERTHGASVLFEGEFYGPPLPDPKLSEEMQKPYHPG